MMNANEVRAASNILLLAVLEDTQGKLQTAAEPNPVWVRYRDDLVKEAARRKLV